MKHLIVCADGTWNTPDQEDNGILAPTNVVRFRNCLSDNARIAARGNRRRVIEQRVYYHPGVGTEGGWLRRTAGGAWGHGLSRNIQSAYHWLGRHYQPGDRIFLIGLSRGAYTVRSLGGWLHKCGLLDLTGIESAEGWRRIEAAYRRGYREKQARGEWAEDWTFHHDKDPPIRFMGVWDTIGALGIPDDLALLNLFDKPENWRFHDTTLGDNIGIARHAVALDEMRASFTPTVWTAHAKSTDLKQVWFPGTHGDVGGGYAEIGLSDGALKWMIDEARRAGLAFSRDLVKQIEPDPHDVLHNSLKGIFKAHRSRPRAVPNVSNANHPVHASARKRHRTPSIEQGLYRSTRVLRVKRADTVNVYARDHWNYTGLYLLPGEYEFQASGEWLDGSVTSGPGGTADGEFQLGELAHLAGSAVGWLERGWKRALGQKRADFWLSRRHEQWPWFALIGVVANSSYAPQNDGTPVPHQTFLIGRENTLAIGEAGYLYAYANDAWKFHDSNRGSVRLQIKRLSATT
ncbi:MAG: hypothetical protein MAG794_00347 [Gammaproteobacteria bacterium]|nr:hypothetical protein [Gammaproteobacteria bacterium]